MSKDTNIQELKSTEVLAKNEIGQVYLRNDLVFKRVFGDERNGNILRNFLKASIDLKDNDLTKIEIIDPSTKINTIDDKTGILDIKCTTSTGKIIGIEIQVENDKSMKKRLIFRNAKNLADQLKRGENYSKIKKVITMAISINHTIIKEGNYYKYCFKFNDSEKNINLSDISQINIFEAKNLPKEYEDDLIKWLRFIKSESPEEMEMLANKNSGINEALCVYKELTADEAFRIQAWDRQLYLWSLGEQLNIAKEEGEAKGIQIGEAKGIQIGEAKGIQIGGKDKAIEIARNLLNSGLEIEFISNNTGLSIEQINALK